MMTGTRDNSLAGLVVEWEIKYDMDTVNIGADERTTW